MKPLLSRLSRATSSGRFIPEIDGLRFVAIGAVVAYHLGDFVRTKTGHAWGDSALSLFLSHGYFGVPLFFVISGFIISLPFLERIVAEKPRPSLRRYYLRRLSRLEPPYFINLLVIYLLLVLFRGLSAGELAPHLLASLTYTHNFVYDEFSLVNFVAWSLELELQFYLLAPLLVHVFRIGPAWLRRGVLVLAILVLMGPVSGWVAATDHSVRLMFLSYAGYFLTGFLLADVYVRDWGGAPERGFRWDWASLLAWGALALMLYRPSLYRPVLPLVILFAYLAAFRGTASSWFFSRPLVYTIGGMCYTIYLYHFYMISAVGGPLLGFFDGRGLSLTELTLAMLLLVTPVVIVSSAVLYLLFERPFMKKGWHHGLREKLGTALALHGRRPATTEGVE